MALGALLVASELGVGSALLFRDEASLASGGYRRTTVVKWAVSA
jgi:hypothetical protein